MSRDLTANWLRHNVARYQHADRVYSDVIAAIDSHPSLRPKTDVYTFDDGRTQLLLCVHGLLPISFRNASYNIPIAIWIVLSYPTDAPLAYVVPTSDMLVRPSAHIDHSGRCSIDYITHWARKPEACSLGALLEAMQSHFSMEPPLYAKSRPKPPDGPSRTASPPASSPNPAHRSAPSDRGHVNEQAATSSPPRLPPKPFVTGPSPEATSTSASHVLGAVPSSPAPSGQFSSASISQTYAPGYARDSSPATGTEVRDSGPPPVPPHPLRPPQVFGSTSSTAPSPGAPQVTGRGQSPQGPPPYVSDSPPVPPRPPLPPSPFAHQRVASSPPQPPANSITPPPAVPRAYTQPPPPLPFQPVPSGSATIPAPQFTQEYPNVPGYQQPPAPPHVQVLAPSQPLPSQPPPDLLDEDGDLDIPQPVNTGGTDSAPPPRPPNPQTVALHNALLSSFRDALSRLATTHSDAIARQRAAQAELLAGPEAIRDESARLVAVGDVCCAVGDRWEALIADGEHALGEMRRRGEVSVDEMVCTSSIVGNQLVNLVAEDNAIEDTIYHLHRALVSGRIDLERFLRTTRVLAEEQFMKRALVEKILRGLPMGLALR